MPTPPASWELATPVYGIRYPRPTAPARYLPDAFGHIGTDLENALLAAAFPPGTQYKTGTSAERLAATPQRDLIWVETDTGNRYIGTGTGWILISGNPTAQSVRFTGNISISNFGVTGGVNIGYTAIDDPQGGWDSAANVWWVPQTGNYLLMVAMKQNNTLSGASIGFFRNNVAIGQSGNLSATNYGGQQFTMYENFNAGQAISVRASTNYQTQADPPHMTNFAQFFKIG